MKRLRSGRLTNARKIQSKGAPADRGKRETERPFSDSGFCVSPNGICHEALKEISAGVNMAVLTERERARAMMVTLEVSEGGRKKKKTLIIYKYIYAHKHSRSICGGNAQVYSGTRGRRCIHDVSIEPGIHRPTKLELVK